MGVEVSGLLGLIVLILNIYAIVKTVQSAAGNWLKGIVDCFNHSFAGYWFHTVVLTWAKRLTFLSLKNMK